MSVKLRTRSLTFRVSEEEYKDLVALLEAQSARSLSDFVRTYVLGLSKIYDFSPAASCLQFSRIEQRLAELQQSLKTLITMRQAARSAGDEQ